jgi:predicted HicB family RNase H-like nuclease
MAIRKKLSLDVIENLKNSSSLTEQTDIKQKAKNNSENTKYHFKNLRYPEDWHQSLKEAKKNGKTSLNEAAYILEALREKMTSDSII